MKVTCPNCGQRLNVAQAMLGKKGRCQACKAVITIPAESQPAAVEQDVPMIQQATVHWAIASLVCGVLGILTCWFFGLGVVFSICAVVFYALQRREGTHGMATAGLVLGIVGIPLNVCIGGCAVLVTFGSQAIEAAKEGPKTWDLP